MGDDSGGVRALRTWARDAAARADALTTFAEAPLRAAPDPGVRDRTIGELAQLAGSYAASFIHQGHPGPSPGDGNGEVAR